MKLKLERTINTKRNIIFGEIDKVIGILLPFVVRTMIINLMAVEYLGLTSLFYSIIQMLNLVELGFGTAIIYSMYKPIAENDVKKINALLRFYTRVYRVMGCLVTAAGLLIMFFLPSLISGNVPEDTNIYVLYLIFLTNASLNFFLFPNQKALITAYQRDDLLGKMHIITQLLMYMLQIICVCLARNFYLYALTIPVSTIAYNFLCAYQSRKYYPHYKEEGLLEESEYREIRKQVIGLMVRKVATLSRNAFDAMFISAFLGLQLTALYGNYYYIMDSVVMVLAVVKTSMAGGVGNSIATESVEKNLKDMKTINFLFMSLSGWCMTALLCLYQPFMKIWVGTEMMFPFGIVVLFSVYFYVLKMGDIRTLYAESIGIWWQSRYLSVAEALSNLALNYVLIRFMGIYGIIIATLISYFAFNFLGGAVVLFKYYFTKDAFFDYLIVNVKYAVVTSLVAGITYCLVSVIGLEGWSGLIVKGGTCGLVSGIMYLVIYMNGREFKNAIPLIRSLVRKR